MKRCTYCGKECPDEIQTCPTDGMPLQTVGQEPPQAGQESPEVRQVWQGPGMSPPEKRFWERMTFRQLAIVIVRMQALWLFFNAMIDLTYLPRYLTRTVLMSGTRFVSIEANLDFVLMLSRIALNVGAGLALFLGAGKVLSWLVKDEMEKQAAEANLTTPEQPQSL